MKIEVLTEYEAGILLAELHDRDEDDLQDVKDAEDEPELEDTLDSLVRRKLLREVEYIEDFSGDTSVRWRTTRRGVLALMAYVVDTAGDA